MDGCFLKRQYGGQLLAACGIDPNNNWYPFCYAIVEAETKETWHWFINYMRDDLDVVDSAEWTMISDKQKGLLDAVSILLPNAEHIFCVLHMLVNMSVAGFRGLAYKDYLLQAAYSTAITRYNHFMNELAKYDEMHFFGLQTSLQNTVLDHISELTFSVIICSTIG